MSTSQNIIVTGANGYLGSYVCRELISRGIAVIALKYDHYASVILDHPLIRYVHCDITQEIAPQIATATEGLNISALINTAALLGSSDYERNYAVNPNTLTNIVYSSVVNGLDITDYDIIDDCGDGPPPQSDAINLPSDAVAEFRGILPTAAYFTGLTRDDVAGLRYMLTSHNVNQETTGPATFAFVTNSLQELLIPSDLTVLTEAAATNSAAELEALFPGLQVSSTSNYFVNVVTTNLVAYFTNFPYAPVGSPPQLVVTTTLTTNVATRYIHTFGNIIIQDGPYPYCRQTLLTTTIAPDPYAPVGSGLLVTNSTTQSYINTNCVSGSYFILPAGACDFYIASTQLTQVVTSTNVIYDVSTSVDTTNFTGFYAETQSIVSYWTNQTLVGRAVTCPEDVGGLRRGIEKVSFFQRDYDSLLGQLFEPFTNYYNMVTVVNNQNFTQRVGRVVSQPDFRLTAEDLVTPEAFFVVSRNVSFSTNSGGGQYGPGTITPSSLLTFNNVGLAFFGGPSLDTNVFLTQADFSPQFLWASFGGTTNANDPVIYPNGVSIQEVENIMLMQIVTPGLPTGTVGVIYNSGSLTGQGGTPPYVWSLAPYSQMPPGLSPPNPVAGNIIGLPTVAGIYDFDVRMTDSAGRYVDRAYTLTINAP